MAPDGTCLRKWITVCISNFDEISQCTAEKKLLPVSENGRPPYLNCTSGFDFLPVCSYRDVILHLPAKFCSNPTTGGKVMMSY